LSEQPSASRDNQDTKWHELTLLVILLAAFIKILGMNLCELAKRVTPG
jgi:hypothetical protein